jgi:hypothetical protein
MRIVQAFLPDRQLTTSDLRSELPDVPSATLYRQVAELARGEVLHVVREDGVRGTVERTYRLRIGAGHIDPEAARQLSVDEHRQLFLTFTAGVLADFDGYLDGDDVDLGRDLVGYRRTAMYLSDEETTALVADLRAILHARMALPPSPDRTRRVLVTVLVPETLDRTSSTFAEGDSPAGR